MLRRLLLLFLFISILEARVDKPLMGRLGVGVFVPECTFFRDIYGMAPIYHFQVNYAFMQNLSSFINVSFLWKDGSTVACSDRTTLQLVPLSLGLLLTSKYASPLQAYFGGGVAYSFLWIQDFSIHVDKDISNNRFGAVLKSGLVFSKNDLSLHFFIDALLQKFHFKTSDPSLTCHHANLNALIIGGAIGLRV